MAEYNTEQKSMLINFLKSNCDMSYTIEELVLEMKKLWGDNAPAQSTVYRLITKLTEEGTVKKSAKNGSRRFVYQIVADRHCHNHLHLKCLDCGKIIHLDEETSDELLNKVSRIKNFSVNEEETVLFGKCSSCKK